MKTFVVTDRTHEWFEIPEAAALTARRYLTEPESVDAGTVQVLNLCRTGRYQGRGYYVSLLAEARGQRPVADVKTIENLRSEAFVQALAADLQPLVQETLHHNDSERFQLDVYLGRHPSHQALAEKLFARVRAPLLRVLFVHSEGSWRLDALHAIGLGDIPLQDRALLLEAVRSFISDSPAPMRWSASTSSTPSSTAQALAKPSSTSSCGGRSRLACRSWTIRSPSSSAGTRCSCRNC